MKRIVAKLAAISATFVIVSLALTPGASARVTHRHHGAVAPAYGSARTNGYPIVCGTGIPISPYAADHYIPRPSVCGGAIVNNNLNPDFQLGGAR